MSSQKRRQFTRGLTRCPRGAAEGGAAGVAAVGPEDLPQGRGVADVRAVLLDARAQRQHGAEVERRKPLQERVLDRLKLRVERLHLLGAVLVHVRVERQALARGSSARSYDSGRPSRGRCCSTAPVNDLLDGSG